MDAALYLVPAIIIVVIGLASAIKILREYERGVIFRLGRLIAAKGPGLILLIPVVHKMVKVTTVEVKQVDLPADMQRAMSKQAEAERERRAKVINAEGEYQAAEKLSQAAQVLTSTPIAVQLRFLQTMREVAAERNTTTFFPVPIDLVTPFLTARPGA